MQDSRTVGRRIVVIGTSGAGKATLSRQLALRLVVPHIEADAPAAPSEEFRNRIDQATAWDRWTFDGNYSKVLDLAWSRADTLIWLDYPLPLILWLLLRRPLRRTIGGEVLWNGNRESLWKQFFTRDSLFYWVLTTHRCGAGTTSCCFRGLSTPTSPSSTSVRPGKPRRGWTCSRPVPIRRGTQEPTPLDAGARASARKPLRRTIPVRFRLRNGGITGGPRGPEK